MHLGKLRSHDGLGISNVVEVVLELAANLIKFQPKAVEELAEASAGVDIGQHYYAAPTIEEVDEFGDAQTFRIYVVSGGTFMAGAHQHNPVVDVLLIVLELDLPIKAEGKCHFTVLFELLKEALVSLL